MSEATPAPRRVLLGGDGPFHFAVALEHVADVRAQADLPSRRREVNLPRLLDLPEADAAQDRYARVTPLAEPAFLRLGPAVRAVDLPPGTIQPVPRILEVAAARWGWAGLGMHDEEVIVLLDAPRLARIGARREEDDA